MFKNNGFPNMKTLFKNKEILLVLLKVFEIQK